MIIWGCPILASDQSAALMEEFESSQMSLERHSSNSQSMPVPRTAATWE